MKTSNLTLKARFVAQQLIGNSNTEIQIEAAHLLTEMVHRLDVLDVRAHKKIDGLLLVNGTGGCRYATILERILYRLFGILPQQI